MSDVSCCPECGHGGALDGQGRDIDDFERYSSVEKGWERVKETWYQFRCPECDTVFKTREREVVDSANA